jgi:hypothetical protein
MLYVWEVLGSHLGEAWTVVIPTSLQFSYSALGNVVIIPVTVSGNAGIIN